MKAFEKLNIAVAGTGLRRPVHCCPAEPAPPCHGCGHRAGKGEAHQPEKIAHSGRLHRKIPRRERSRPDGYAGWGDGLSGR